MNINEEAKRLHNLLHSIDNSKPTFQIETITNFLNGFKDRIRCSEHDYFIKTLKDIQSKCNEEEGRLIQDIILAFSSINII